MARNRHLNRGVGDPSVDIFARLMSDPAFLAALHANPEPVSILDTLYIFLSALTVDLLVFLCWCLFFPTLGVPRIMLIVLVFGASTDRNSWFFYVWLFNLFACGYLIAPFVTECADIFLWIVHRTKGCFRRLGRTLHSWAAALSTFVGTCVYQCWRRTWKRVLVMRNRLPSPGAILRPWSESASPVAEPPPEAVVPPKGKVRRRPEPVQLSPVPPPAPVSGKARRRPEPVQLSPVRPPASVSVKTVEISVRKDLVRANKGSVVRVSESVHAVAPITDSPPVTAVSTAIHALPTESRSEVTQPTQVLAERTLELESLTQALATSRSESAQLTRALAERTLALEGLTHALAAREEELNACTVTLLTRDTELTTAGDAALRAEAAARKTEGVVARLVNRVSTECVVCQDAPCTVVLVPCGHFTYCAGCWDDVPGVKKGACPICRAKVAAVYERKTV